MEPGIVMGIVAAVIIFFIDLWLVANIFKSDKPQQTKLGWAAVIFLLPIIGWIIWAKFGPRGMAKGPTSPEHSKG
ncbi:MAG TPA: PLDc_N domain-containing protein [Pseudomonas xinjiangensis]|uniref:PLDc_N domain-containing protein n=2 Tax=root TaxID=1 RepID=A0A7V1BMN3_9GAMM|nr:PLDc_N domain-containing protein [Halopseudomonas xinjiangensis]HEC46882.1 PLDc_N domain-containing protein [Halopseudomonas xinjiangensis]